MATVTIRTNPQWLADLRSWRPLLPMLNSVWEWAQTILNLPGDKKPLFYTMATVRLKERGLIWSRTIAVHTKMKGVISLMFPDRHITPPIPMEVCDKQVFWWRKSPYMNLDLNGDKCGFSAYLAFSRGPEIFSDCDQRLAYCCLPICSFFSLSFSHQLPLLFSQKRLWLLWDISQTHPAAVLSLLGTVT